MKQIMCLYVIMFKVDYELFLNIKKLGGKQRLRHFYFVPACKAMGLSQRRKRKIYVKIKYIK